VYYSLGKKLNNTRLPGSARDLRLSFTKEQQWFQIAYTLKCLNVSENNVAAMLLDGIYGLWYGVKPDSIPLPLLK